MAVADDPGTEPRWTRAAIAAGIAIGVLIQSRSMGIFFHHDDLGSLENLANAADPWSWAFSAHVDHFPLTRNVLYVLFLKAFGARTLPWHVLLLALLAANAALLDALLRRFQCSPAARIVAATTFAATAVFHEAVYWVACSNFALALFFTLLALVCLVRGEERSPSPWRVAALVSSLLALLSASIAGVLPVLAVVVACALPGPLRARRVATFAAIPAVALALAVMITFLARPEGVAKIGGQAASQLDVSGGMVLAVRGLVERLAAGYFTGGRLPAVVALAVLLILTTLAWLRPAPFEGPRRAVSIAGPFAWMLVSGFAAFAFRTWLGEVVFVSRYQLFPAAGFAWLTAHAVDGALEVAAKRGPRWHARARAAVLGVLLPAVLGLSAYAHAEVAERWRSRTEALKRAHEEIGQGLRALAAEARTTGRPVVMPDSYIGGGTGYRPRLAKMGAYLLSREDRGLVTFAKRGQAPLPPSLGPLVDDLRRGRPSWVEWLDDLSVSDAAPESGGQPATVRVLFPVFERVVVTDEKGMTRLQPLGQGQLAVLRTGPRDDIARWKTLSFRVRAVGEGEILVAFTGPTLPDLGRGARIHLEPGEERRVVIDVPLAARGHVDAVREVEIRLVGELTAYEMGQVTIG